ncbi:hypothetical protein [Rubrimonas cliftonensis]|uniref:Uncharacterized protein n=1 Tax=Rubrimonas cliftonensis TaxID=89524 RepID=A0A1H3W4Q9_9RHOB|nr:hypothetical protein [Rubrimonas cliftonensis]SDZ82046.1 hypothetical protein SAMN05444370_101515 [Rubrimonas cliftonensis]
MRWRPRPDPTQGDRAACAAIVALITPFAVSPRATASAALRVAAAPGAGAGLPPGPDCEARAVCAPEGSDEIVGDRFGGGRILPPGPGDPHAARAVTAARAAPFGGEPTEGPRWSCGSIIASRPEDVAPAKADRARGRFDGAPGDAADVIPPPEGSGRPRRAGGGRAFP